MLNRPLQPRAFLPLDRLPFVSASMDSRALRLRKDSSRWILDSSPKADMTEYLALQMEQSVSPELFTALFSKDHRAEEDYMAGLAVLADFYVDSAAPLHLVWRKMTWWRSNWQTWI